MIALAFFLWYVNPDSDGCTHLSCNFVPPTHPPHTCGFLASSRLEHAVSVLPMSIVHCFDLSHRNSLIGQMLSVSQYHRHHLHSVRGAMQVAMTSLLCSKAAYPMSLQLPPQPAPTDQPPMKWCTPLCLGHTARASLGSALLSLRRAATAECSSPLWVRKWALSWAGMGPISARSDRSVGTAKSACHCSCFLLLCTQTWSGRLLTMHSCSSCLLFGWSLVSCC